MPCTVFPAAGTVAPPRAMVPASTKSRTPIGHCSNPSATQIARLLLNALLDELDAIHHAESLRFGLLATAFALVDAHLDLVD